VLQYRIYVNGEHKGVLSEDEYQTIRKEIRGDYRYWIAACIKMLGLIPKLLVSLVKGLAIMGGLGFCSSCCFHPSLPT